ncbi:MAG TPA: BON domain-containing protein [Woeseiaceae bacterium]|nr:BON domain-containing protein [Woeseiaceae bacterium]
MRFVILPAILLLSGCTAMLLGGGSGGGQAGPGERSSTQIAADASISAAIRDRFAADSVLGHYRLGIETRAGRVTLQGAVDTYAARSRAGALVRQVEGVVSVNNRIRVSSGN